MFANTIKDILKDSNKSLTQNDLAAVLGMTKQSFSNKMSRDTFTVQDMIKIASYLDMTVVLKSADHEYIVQ
ncbi:MAG: helix-turn-helix domain-containing protein [Lachnospiraceae bacterium]|nr:helix-turn-helix domain-containing protein [Lachnospiraceae bacterium]